MGKIQFQLEFSINSSPKIIYNRLATPSGLSEWFADNVNVENNYETFIFIWEGSPTKANVINQKELSYIRFQWQDDADEDENTYFEFRIMIDELTKDLALVITDFAEADEIVDSKQLWNTQIEKLKHVLGS